MLNTYIRICNKLNPEFFNDWKIIVKGIVAFKEHFILMEFYYFEIMIYLAIFTEKKNCIILHI